VRPRLHCACACCDRRSPDPTPLAPCQRPHNTRPVQRKECKDWLVLYDARSWQQQARVQVRGCAASVARQGRRQRPAPTHPTCSHTRLSSAAAQASFIRACLRVLRANARAGWHAGRRRPVLVARRRAAGRVGQSAELQGGRVWRRRQQPGQLQVRVCVVVPQTCCFGVRTHSAYTHTHPARVRTHTHTHTLCCAAAGVLLALQCVRRCPGCALRKLVPRGRPAGSGQLRPGVRVCGSGCGVFLFEAAVCACCSTRAP
jgi:hypothetical protein